MQVWEARAQVCIRRCVLCVCVGGGLRYSQIYSGAVWRFRVRCTQTPLKIKEGGVEDGRGSVVMWQFDGC